MWVVQEATSVFGSLIVQHIEPDQTVTGVAQLVRDKTRDHMRKRLDDAVYGATG